MCDMIHIQKFLRSIINFYGPLLSAAIETVFFQMKPVNVSGQYKVPLIFLEIIVQITTNFLLEREKVSK